MAYDNSLSIILFKFKNLETNSSMQIRVNISTKICSKKNEIPAMPQHSKYVFVPQQPAEPSVNQTIIENDQQSQIQEVYQNQIMIQNAQYTYSLDQSMQQFQIQLKAVDQDQTIIQYIQHTFSLDQTRVHNLQEFETTEHH
ncbi:hypothetical protein C2G38_2176810 [Gigaspora rosea]|uniref:Uncharacterized protein n=1 Tax=Gigaspora rosea TaxID=44941 RepID=A0A397VFY6_9GLOM|nr:hypothetical protein C2G38_2176810 [Gigaspora rosea]